MTPDSGPVLSVRNLVTELETARGTVRVVDDVSFEVPAKSKVGLVGESGSGKTLTALSVLRLLPEPEGRIRSGGVFYHDLDLCTLSERAMRRLRGNKLSMVFQEPMSALNPVFSVGWQMMEALQAHRSMSRSQARQQCIELLRKVGIDSPESRFRAYPHELSGGMRQRVLLAMAVCCEPELLIADEPTTALDVTIQAQIMDLLEELRQQSGMAVLLISHDLALVASFVDQVVVMYAGRVVETAPVRQLFQAPAHPYTQGLLQSLPKGRSAPVGTQGPLPTLKGQVPELTALPSGCRFHPRCPKATEFCKSTEPELTPLGEQRWARCHYAQEKADG